MKGVAVLILSLSISACGFAPRGTHHALSDTLPTVRILPHTPGAPLYKQAARTLKAAGVLQTDASNAPTLHLSTPTFTQKTLAYGPAGQTRRQRLTYAVHYSLKAPDGSTRIKQRVLQTQRDRQLNSDQDLGDAQELSLFKQEMEHDLMQQLLLQLIQHYHDAAA